MERRLDGLLDEPRPGALRRVCDAQIERVVRLTLESTPADGTHWSTRAMARRSGLSQTMISRMWRAFAWQPHRVEGCKLSKAPLFIEKVRDIVGLYLNPPDRALVLCVDEKARIQALDRSQPLLPMRPGQAERRAPDDLNPHLGETRRGAIRHIYVAGDEREVDRVARPAYKAYYNNIVKLWRDFRTLPAYGFTDDLDLARANDVAIAGTANEVRDRVASFFADSGCDYLVLSFAWGNLAHADSRRSLERFVTRVMPDFALASLRSAD